MSRENELINDKEVEAIEAVKNSQGLLEEIIYCSIPETESVHLYLNEKLREEDFKIDREKVVKSIIEFKDELMMMELYKAGFEKYVEFYEEYPEFARRFAFYYGRSDIEQCDDPYCYKLQGCLETLYWVLNGFEGSLTIDY